MHMQSDLDHDMRSAVQIAVDCAAVCAQAVGHCVNKGGAHAEPAHLILLLACAQSCHTAAQFMAIGSPQHPPICGACAEVCTACAADCERLSNEDPVMRDCADICRKCAESCARMASPTAARI
jgi:hypothetical protein